MADFADQDDSLIPLIGKIYLYITANDPATLDFTTMKHLVIKHKVTSSLATILTEIGDRHSPVRSKFRLLFNNVYSYHHLGRNQRVYTLEDDEWMVKGRYEFAVRNNEEVIWSKVDGDHVTRILIVCLLIFIRKCFKYSGFL
jgi:hypothetical protein